MDPRTVIACRIDLQLRHHLGQGVDSSRTLTDARYARDVLLVCDAMAGTGLPLLARQFRTAGACQPQPAPRHPGHDAGPPQDWAADTSGFGHSLPPAATAPQSNRKRWFSLRRWLGD